MTNKNSKKTVSINTATRLKIVLLRKIADCSNDCFNAIQEVSFKHTIAKHSNITPSETSKVIEEVKTLDK